MTFVSIEQQKISNKSNVLFSEFSIFKSNVCAIFKAIVLKCNVSKQQYVGWKLCFFDVKIHAKICCKDKAIFFCDAILLKSAFMINFAY